MARVVKLGSLSWTSPDHNPKQTAKVSGNQGVHQGKMIGYKVVASDATNPITFTVAIKDQDGDVIYTSPAESENGTRIRMDLDIPLVEKEVVEIDPSGDPGVSNFTCSNITLYYHPDVLERAR